VLLVLGADAAVERAVLLDLGLELERQRAGLVEAQLTHVQLGIGVDKRLEAAVLRAALAQQHAVVADVDLGVDDLLAHRADRLRVLEEDLVAVDPRALLRQRHLAPFVGSGRRSDAPAL
jgi:hypothetical protein